MDRATASLSPAATTIRPKRLNVFERYLSLRVARPCRRRQYIAGSIILAAAPGTAMVFVWSFLTDGDPAYTLVQVSVNDLLMLVLFAPIVTFLVSGASSLHVPFQVLLYSVLVFIAVPLTAGVLLRQWFMRAKGRAWFENVLLPRFAPVSMCACMIKGIERVAPMLKFSFRGVEIRVHGIRQDVPPRMERIDYEIVVDTDEPDRRLELLHDNVRKYGTVFNTVAPGTVLDGILRRAS